LRLLPIDVPDPSGLAAIVPGWPGSRSSPALRPSTPVPPGAPSSPASRPSTPVCPGADSPPALRPSAPRHRRCTACAAHPSCASSPGSSYSLTPIRLGLAALAVRPPPVGQIVVRSGVSSLCLP